MKNKDTKLLEEAYDSINEEKSVVVKEANRNNPLSYEEAINVIANEYKFYLQKKQVINNNISTAIMTIMAIYRIGNFQRVKKDLKVAAKSLSHNSPKTLRSKFYNDLPPTSNSEL